MVAGESEFAGAGDSAADDEVEGAGSRETKRKAFVIGPCSNNCGRCSVPSVRMTLDSSLPRILSYNLVDTRALAWLQDYLMVGPLALLAGYYEWIPGCEKWAVDF